MGTIVPKKADKFPLFKHPRGYWCKTVLGKHKYFGKVVDDPSGKAALKLWLQRKDYYLAGLEPPACEDDAISVKYICNKFLAAKEARLESGNLSKRTFDELKEVCEFFMSVVPGGIEAKNLAPQHFEKFLAALQSRYKAPASRGKRVGIIRSVFKYGYDNRLIERPTHFGSEFKKPTAKTYREHRNTIGDRSFSNAEVKALLAVATVQEKAMVLLGLQAGFGNTEISELPKTAINGDWVQWPRAKTAINRLVPLWKETKSALRAVVAQTPNDYPLVFANEKGGKISDHRFVSYMFARLAKRASVDKHVFYDLRRTFQTISENHAQQYDLAAIRAIMGHADDANDMSSEYRQNISDERLKAVTDAVRNWLFATPKKRGAK
jgi:integrase